MAKSTKFHREATETMCFFERELTESHLTLRCRTSSAPTAANVFWRPYESIIHIWKCNLHMTADVAHI
jgi:hypothetical protein